MKLDTMTAWLRSNFPTISALMQRIKKARKKPNTCCNCGAVVDWGVVCRPCRFGTSGFAVVSAVFVLALMTILSVAMMHLSTNELRSSNALLRGSQAFYAADAGLREAHANFVDPKLESGDSVVGAWVSLPGKARYRIITQRVDARPRWTDGTYMLRAEGRVGSGHASNRLAVFIQIGRKNAGIPVPAALSAPAGLVKHGNSGTLSGYDDGTCGSDSLPGVFTGGEVETSGPDTLFIEGDPPIYVSTDPVMTWEEVLAIEPTHTVDPDNWNWDAAMFDEDQAPVVFVDGNVSLSAGESGRGVLIVNGSLTTNGSWIWDGLLLVGDGWTSNGNNTLNGAALVGLRDPSAGIDLGNGTKSFQFNSCEILRAQKAAGPQDPYILKWMPLF